MIKLVTTNNKRKTVSFSQAVEQMAHLANRGHGYAIIVDDGFNESRCLTLMGAINALYNSVGLGDEGVITFVTLKELD